MRRAHVAPGAALAAKFDISGEPDRERMRGYGYRAGGKPLRTAAARMSSPIRTLTVGPGISPDQSHWRAGASPGVAGFHRRWGITPRPENINRILSLALTVVNMPVRGPSWGSLVQAPLSVPAVIARKAASAFGRSSNSQSIFSQKPSSTVERKTPSSTGAGW